MSKEKLDAVEGIIFVPPTIGEAQCCGHAFMF
jgi:hypothetical protein